MPRKEINLDCRLDYLSILDENGQADEELLPDLPEQTLLRMHRAMLLSRRLDERMLMLQRQGRIGTFAPVKGQEAAQVGSMAAVEQQDWFVPSFRETAAAVWRGAPLVSILLYAAGYNEGARPGEGRRDLPPSIPVASQIPHAVGLAYAARMRGGSELAIVFFGDGATSEGDFHEALNFAGVFHTPVIFLCQNNQWAISVPREHQTRSKTLAQKALAYGLAGIQVDGNDVLAVYQAVREAAGRARNEGCATLVECVTYRLSLHTTADDPSKYRDEEEVKDWERCDPITRFQTFLKNRQLLSDDGLAKLEEEVKAEIEQAWKETQEQARTADPAEMFAHMYGEMPPYLAQQADAFRQGTKDPHG